MESNNQVMPPLMQQLHKIPSDDLDEDGIDFEPYQSFLSVEATQNWFQAWTGNQNADASSFLIFGQDGTGGYAVFWLIRDGKDLLEQPIVFFGSEGELGVIAQNFSDYLWLLAGGCGPYEAAAYSRDEEAAGTEFLNFATQHATTPQKEPSEIIARADAEFPDFEENIRAMCR